MSQWRRDTPYLKLPIPYTHAAELAGADSIVISSFEVAPDEDIPAGLEVRGGYDPHDASALDDVHALLVPGGGDVDPALYRAERHPRTHSINRQHDRYELTLLKAAIERDMPVLAICRGMQLLNVCLGGTLIQHLGDKPQLLDHDRDRPRAEAAHKVRVKERSPLVGMLGSTTAEVNSHHHQGLDRVGAGLEEIAWAEDGVLEAVMASDRTWVYGVQWHPEAMAPIDRRQLAIFEELVDAADAYRMERAQRVARSA